ncbi:phenylacetate-CoA ligase [Desulfatibacillum alkenivorans DSM 16219]|jgi:phenylacetate-CoA ligase|uniref:Phenylacetate-CoA ligase n=1 Tax=Desulfatibacillum alkenivorans DSM 16219 TaxID=1121393 RepID=A0A1M6UFR3_9BACT|nr:phenylacetate--CoA ligase family protein [Desulfatibacillum alkenivorans]SHK68009.1 phenylacetate-CoA ligase [Desulfatibacillum alkenivorans DSM 16219]
MNLTELIQRNGYRIKGDRRYHYYDILKKNLTLTKDEMVQLQNRLLQDLIQHAYFSTSYYRNIMDGLNLKPNDIRDKTDLQKMPALTKTDIRQNINALKSTDKFGNNLFLDYSGGSTGNVAVIYKSPFFSQFQRAAYLRNNLIAKWQPSDKVVWLWGAPYEHHQLKDSMIAKIGILINRRMLFNAYKYSPDDFPKWVDKIKKFKPKIIYGYASIILELSKFLIVNDVRFPTVKCVISTTETLEGRETIENAFNCDVYDQYGCREIPAIGIESAKNIMRIADDVVALNVNDDNEFLVTALHSYGFPLINYKLGDCGTVVKTSEEDCPDNIPFSCMELKIGRITDNFLTRSGRKIASSAIGVYVSSFRIPLMEYQVIQNSYDEFVINFIPEGEIDQQNLRKIFTLVFREYFGSEVKLTFNRVKNIAVEKSGKKLMYKRMFQME